MLRTKTVAIALSCIAAGCSSARSTEELSEIKMDVAIAVADNPDYIQRWLTTPSEQSVGITRASVFTSGETAYCSILVGIASAAGEQKFDVTADIRIENPDGSLLFEEKGYAATDGVAANQKRWFMLDPALDLGFDDTDPSGTYTVFVSVKDGVSGMEAKAEEQLVLTDSAASKQTLVRPIASAEQLDRLWAHYFDTGNVFAVRRIISTLHWKEDGQDMEIVIAGAARWSLTSNAKIHPEVLEICKEEQARRDGVTSTILGDIVAEATATAN